MNLAERLSAARVYDLAHPLEPATPTSPNHPPFRLGLIRRRGDSVRADGSSAANERFTMGGHTGTHIDALCHVSADGRLHGGADATEAARGGRFTVHGESRRSSRSSHRGVLLDVPRALGLDVLPLAHAFRISSRASRGCRRRGARR